MNITQLIPPILIPVLRRITSSKGIKGIKVYQNYASALSDCSKLGYENSDIVKVVVEKTRIFRNEINENKTPLFINSTNAFSLCSILATLDTRMQVNVLDFGGAAGAHYFIARKIIPAKCALKWMVVETPAMVKRAAPLLSNDELSFSSDINMFNKTLESIDLLHTSGTLQCVDDPYVYLHKIISIKPKYILFNRLGLTRGDHDVITIHKNRLSWNGPGPMPNGMVDMEISYPFNFLIESKFNDILLKDYIIETRFEDNSGIFPVNNEPIVGSGVLAKRRYGV